MNKQRPSENSQKPAQEKPWNPLEGLTSEEFKEARLKAEKPRLPVPVVFPVND